MEVMFVGRRDISGHCSILIRANLLNWGLSRSSSFPAWINYLDFFNLVKTI